MIIYEIIWFYKIVMFSLIIFLLETLQMNALSEMGVDYIDTEKEDSSQLSAQEAVVKSAKLGKKGQFIVQV